MKTRRIIEEHNVRKITKVTGGTSYAVTLPIDIIRRWGWFTLLNDFKLYH